jgi:multidrug efflux pump
VPLGLLTRIEERAAPLSLNRQGQFPGSHDLVQPGASGLAQRSRQEIDRARLEIKMPDSVQAEFQGTARAFETSLRNQPLLILAALVTVYIVLGVLK